MFEHVPLFTVEELFELVQLSEVPIDKELFKVVSFLQGICHLAGCVLLVTKSM